MLVTVADSGGVRVIHQRGGWYKRDRLGAIVGNTIFGVGGTGGRTGRTGMVGTAYQSHRAFRVSGNPKREPESDRAGSLTFWGLRKYSSTAHKKSMVGTMRPCFKLKQDWSFQFADARK